MNAAGEDPGTRRLLIEMLILMNVCMYARRPHSLPIYYLYRALYISKGLLYCRLLTFDAMDSNAADAQ
jgi:hypothetical protein